MKRTDQGGSADRADGQQSETNRYDGPERRQSAVPDRRKTHRGGRRITDTLARIANFVYDLLTEPPH